MELNQPAAVAVAANCTKRYSPFIPRSSVRFGRLGWLLASVLLAGCAALPDPNPGAQDNTPPKIAVEPVGALSPDAAPQAWWTLFNDPLLAQLERELDAGNLDLQRALAQVEQSQARLGVAAAAQAVQLDGSGAYSRSRLSEYSRLAALGASTDPGDYWSLGAGVSWELDLWGQLRQRTQAAGKRLLAQQYAHQGVRVSLSAELARSYLLLRGVQQQLRLAHRELEINRELLRLQESRRAQGVATDYETASARAAVASARARLPQLEEQRDQLMNALALLLGRAPEALNDRLEEGTGQPELPSRLPVGVPSELARQRPDILAAEAQLQAATADVAAARADFYPRITLGLGAGLEAMDSADFGSWGSRSFALGPSLYLPIFQGGRLHRMLELNAAEQKEAAIAYRQTVLAAWHEVDDAFKVYRDSRRRFQALQQALADQKQAVEAVRRARRHGYASQMAVLQAELASLHQQQALTDATTASSLRVVGLYRALGGGWSAQLAAHQQAGGTGD